MMSAPLSAARLAEIRASVVAAPHPAPGTWALGLRELLAEVDRLREERTSTNAALSQAVEENAALKAQRERRRLRLVALQNDALNMRGTLSPSGRPRRVPMELGETLTPVVEWLLERVAELEAEAYRLTFPPESPFRHELESLAHENACAHMAPGCPCEAEGSAS